MNIQVSLYATLAKYLPPGTKDRSMQLSMPESARVKDILSRMGVPEQTVKLIFVNGVHADLEKQLADGDRVGIFPPVGGG